MLLPGGGGVTGAIVPPAPAMLPVIPAIGIVVGGGTVGPVTGGVVVGGVVVVGGPLTSPPGFEGVVAGGVTAGPIGGAIIIVGPVTTAPLFAPVGSLEAQPAKHRTPKSPSNCLFAILASSEPNPLG